MSKASLELGGGNWAAKDGKLLGYAVGDTSGKYLPREFTFSRGADIAATRVNKDGLIEKYRENALLNSGDFSIAGASGGWVKNSATVTSGYAGYDGTTNAWKLESTVLTSYNNLNQQAIHNAAITPLASKVSTFSVYLKAGTTNWARLNLNNTGNVYFDLENGVVGTASNADVLGQIESAGNGFYRCSITRLSGDAFDICYIYLAESDENILPNTHSTPEHIFVQHPQLEYGLVATDYIETDSSTASAGVLDDLPRIDYTSGSAQLLMEPSRTNICLNSEGVDSLAGGATATLDQDVVSPTGYKGGVVELTNLLGAANDRKQFVADIASDDRGEDFSASVYVKGTSGETFTHQFKRITGATFKGTTKTQHTFNGEWELIQVTFTTAADTEKVGFHFINDGGNDTADSMYIWGMQIEKGRYATSYIPTYGAQDTRAFDNVDQFDTSALGFGTTCSIYFEGVINEATGSYLRPVTMFGSGLSTSERFLLFGQGFSGGTYTLTSRHNSGGATNGVDKTGLTVGEKVKCVSVFDGTSQKFFVNGSSAGTDTVPEAEIFEYLDLSNIAADQNHTIESLQLYPVALSDAECIALTTL